MAQYEEVDMKLFVTYVQKSRGFLFIVMKCTANPRWQLYATVNDMIPERISTQIATIETGSDI